ncbi:MarR family transcriptional regulator [Adlercreutzia sp. R25]|uniref:MarR family transcriptional regulator n=1 Tax=Adlercreutzia shanghongiae TaxID=3111773 RepID=A0ABU6IZ50_9ACTN|nr:MULTISPECIES: MarR family transcriptional regulator [unclassified Adlercreutzia]MEC4273544.1 MarR family transcriptional regulator [Adlercreutzia sp. R25]MEC4294950.1 MarR family transcriptional regulator [Adlercreutzia sp. R22]
MVEAASKFNLDSTYFVAFEMAHEALRRGLESASKLNITQYRILTKLMQAAEPMNQGKLGAHLGMKPNVVTQAVDALVLHGLVTRKTGSADGRTRFLAVTEAGAEHVAAVNQSLVESLYTSFPTSNPTYRTILEAAVSAGAAIEPPLNKQAASRFPASRALVSVELLRTETERTLREATGASMNECRIVQRLGESSRPERVGALADALLMSPVNAARAVDRLVQRGWAKRLKSPRDKKAVYVALTDEGVYEGFLIGATVNELAATKLWANLSPIQRDAIEQMGHVVVADLDAQRQAKEQAEYDLLQEI